VVLLLLSLSSLLLLKQQVTKSYPSTIANDEVSNMILNEARGTVSQVTNPTVTATQHAECHSLAKQQNQCHLAAQHHRTHSELCKLNLQA